MQRKIFAVNSLGATTPEQKDLIQKDLQSSESEVARYEKEKTDIKKEAENLDKENALVTRKGNQFSLAVVFFQIGIMLSSVSALLKRKEMWIIGLVFGCIASIYLANGLLLFF